MEERKVLRFASVGAAAVAFIVYVLTLAPTVSFIDSGELATVAYTFGIAHPTGYPLYTILAGLWSKFPIGDVVYRLNVLSALFCAAGIGVFVRLLYMLLGISQARGAKTQPKGKSKKGKSSPRPVEATPAVRLAAAVFGALVIAFSETYWATALSNEVYPLHVLFVSLVLYYFTAAMFLTEPGTRRERMAWVVFALILGLSFTNHMTTVLFAPAFLIIFFWKKKFTPDAYKHILIAIPSFLLGLVPYVYLPIRSAQHPFMNWGDTQTWENFIRHVSGKQYQVWIFSGEATGRQFNYFWSSYPMEFAVVMLVFIVIGLVFAYRRHKQIGTMLWILFLTCLFYSINYDIYDIDSYFLLAYIVSGIWAAYGMLWVALHWMKNDFRYAVGLATVCVGILLGVHWGNVTEKGDYLVEDYTKNMFHSMEKNALVISYQWDYWVSASMYYQRVEGLRPDVVVLDKELMRRSWYLTHIQYHFPRIYAASRPEFEAFREDLLKFERDIPYNPQEIEARYNGLINSIIDHAYKKRPVYLTIEMEKQFGQDYIRVPEGMAFHLYKPEDAPSLDKKVWDDFAFRPFHRKGRLIDAMMGFYANMLVNRGIVYFQAARYADAERYFTRAQKYDPENRNALMWLGRLRQATTMSSLR